MRWIPRSRGATPVCRPGTVYGAYPERRVETVERRGPVRWRPDRRYRAIAERAQRRTAVWFERPRERREQGLRELAAQLARQGFREPLVIEALACVAAYVRQTLGVQLFASQYHCAAALLDQRLAEMATGEGKTFAAALAAAVGALAGMPVHVITANDYLAERDARALAPLYESLGLSVASTHEREDVTVRKRAYQADIVYLTAKTVAFDYLRDRLQRGAAVGDLDLRVKRGAAETEPLVLRGLCMAVVDEADSVLIDEAKMPLIISEQRRDESERARIWQSLDIAGRLEAGRHFTTQREPMRANLSAEGCREVENMAREYGPAWLNRRHREELVEQALVARHVLRRDLDYLVRDEEVEIIDAITGRGAPGRVWSRGLHIAVALKEGLPPPAPTDTRARITYPRLFARYHHLTGLSGSLREVRAELRSTYGLTVIEVPLTRPSRRSLLPARAFATRIDLFRAALARARQVVESGRPVLLATDSVADSRWIADQLGRAGVAHALLNAQTAAEEAELIALAGEAARVTVATQIAGRGTDIKLSEVIAARGGLHVLSVQHNRSRRVDRQIAGRAGRQGEPGSIEHWITIESALVEHAHWTRWMVSALRERAPHPWLIRIVVALAQRSAEVEDAAMRRITARQDKEWSRQLHFATISE